MPIASKADNVESGFSVVINPTDIISVYLSDVKEEPLTIEVPYNGVYGDIDDKNYNEILFDRLSEFI